MTAIYAGFKEAEKRFVNENKPSSILTDFDKSGSCALVCIILNDVCYVANLGDSRAILSENSSQKISLLTKDHKPNDPNEKKRIERAGGYIYQGQMNNSIVSPKNSMPWRIFPGRLSVK